MTPETKFNDDVRATLEKWLLPVFAERDALRTKVAEIHELRAMLIKAQADAAQLAEAFASWPSRHDNGMLRKEAKRCHEVLEQIREVARVADITGRNITAEVFKLANEALDGVTP